MGERNTCDTFLHLLEYVIQLFTVYVSCLGRGREQFGDHSEEVRFIHSVLGDFPLVGFFANGEIHKSALYGFTGVLTLFV